VGDRCRLCAFRVAGATEAMADKLAPVGKVEIPQEAFSAALKMDAD
jgi:translation elongation factor EF-4